MQRFHPTIIFRHRKENIKKCSLRGLETRKDFIFLSYPKDSLSHLSNYIVLNIDAPPLSSKDRNMGLLLIDATWKYSEIIYKSLPNNLIIARSIPNGFVTAYPRKQTLCKDPKRGLASIEALYLAYLQLGRNPKGLLDHYYWKDLFLSKNSLFS